MPIRYLKEDSSDNTVRTSAGNLNFNYIPVKPSKKAYKLSVKWLEVLTKRRLEDKEISHKYYDHDLSYLSNQRQAIPYAIAYETAHFGDDIGIVSGKKNRSSVMPLIRTALTTPYRLGAYESAVTRFEKARLKTLERATKLKSGLLEWNKQSQYEAHAQIIFRIRDQFGNGVEHFDVTFKSHKTEKNQDSVEKMIEDRHSNTQDKGTITFYLRTAKFNKRSKAWRDLLANIAPVDIEITGTEPDSEDIAYVPMNMRLDSTQVKTILESFKTTVIDITLVRLPSNKVFAINRS